MAELLGTLMGKLFATYFILYPIIYFVYNWFIAELGFPQYAIPGFWVGFVGFLLFNLVKNTVFRFHK
jgi:hypothetical protein